MKELYKNKFFNLKTLTYCFDKKKDLEEVIVIKERKIITPEEKLDILLADKNFRGITCDLLTIMKSLKINSEPIVIPDRVEKKNIFEEIISDDYKKKYDFFNIFKIMAALIEENK